MVDSDYTPGIDRQSKLRLSHFLGATLVVTALAFAAWYGLKPHPVQLHRWERPGAKPSTLDAPTSQDVSPGVSSEFGEIKQFDFLREVSFLGNRCLMLRHHPTAQRIVLLSSAGNQDEIYRMLFARQLGVTEFSTLIPIFKAGTQFENSLIEVNKVSLDQQGQLVHRPYRMQYKHYLISILQDKKPKLFETYIGRIDQQGEAKALVMTFNTAHYSSMAPFNDLLTNLPQTPHLAHQAQ